MTVVNNYAPILDDAAIKRIVRLLIPRYTRRQHLRRARHHLLQALKPY